MLNKKKILKHYHLLKKYASRSFLHNKIELSIKYIETAAHIGYKYNFQYSDKELEQLIQKIGTTIIQNPIKYNTTENRIVLYDSFAIDGRGLSQQYINALKELDFEILFIYSSNKIGNEIKNELLSHGKVKIVHLNEGSLYDNINKANREILTFKPAYILQHFSPWDILGFIIFSSITSSKRYLINLTDHAYWLGKSCTDYILEFRNYGINLSINQREISIEQLLFQPYYPIQTQTKFQGFPIEVEGKKIVFAGSSFYKIYGRNGVFLQLVKRILDENENVVFLLAGSGNDKPLINFISQNELQNRFILLGNRSDINEVIKRIDIYLNTYPLIGGLMSQYAAVHHKPIIGYTDSDLYGFNDTEDLLQIENLGILVKENIEEFHLAINNLIKNKEAELTNIALTNNCVISPSDFSKQLYLNLTTTQPIELKNIKKNKIDLNTVFELYLDMEVNFLKEHYRILWNKLRNNILRNNIGLGVKIGSYLIFNKYIKLKR